MSLVADQERMGKTTEKLAAVIEQWRRSANLSRDRRHFVAVRPDFQEVLGPFKSAAEADKAAWHKFGGGSHICELGEPYHTNDTITWPRSRGGRSRT